MALKGGLRGPQLRNPALVTLALLKIEQLNTKNNQFFDELNKFERTVDFLLYSLVWLKRYLLHSYQLLSAGLTSNKTNTQKNSTLKLQCL